MVTTPNGPRHFHEFAGTRLPGTFVVLLLVFFTLIPGLWAHDPGLSSLRIFPTNQVLTAAMTYARADIETIVPMDANGDGKISAPEFESVRSTLNQLAGRALFISSTNSSLSLLQPPEVRVDDLNNVEFTFHFPPAEGLIKGESRLIPELPTGHRQFASVYGGTNELTGSFLLGPSNPKFEFVLGSLAGDKSEQSGVSDFFLFFRLGIKHILIGYDHLLFLFGLMLIPIRWLDLLKIITSFTVAHSITLALAAMKVVEIPSHFVEPAIALSIAYIGLENLRRKGEVKNRWLLTFALGLIHGFGFASVLGELGLGENRGEIVSRLIGFNLGVETGQVCVALVVVPILLWAQKKPIFLRRGIPALSVLTIGIGLYWFFERVF